MCVVCSFRYPDATLPCNHKFCTKCILTIYESGLCPLCRREFKDFENQETLLSRLEEEIVDESNLTDPDPENPEKLADINNMMILQLEFCLSEIYPTQEVMRTFDNFALERF